jgi:hypothetical protein
VDWEPILTAVIGALGGGVVGAWLQGRRQARSGRQQRRERAAEVLAEVKAFLVDAHPDRLAFNANQATNAETFQQLRDRIRVPLLALAGGHPSRAVRDLARRLEVALANTFHTVEWLVGDLVRARDIRSDRQDALKEHAKALRLHDELVEAIQRN